MSWLDIPIVNLFNAHHMTALDFLRGHYAMPPYGRSKRTVAQDQRAARKKAAVKKAKARGQTGPNRLSSRARRQARMRRWSA